MHPFPDAGFKQFVFISSDFTVLLTFPEAATRIVLYKKLHLKILQYSQENTCVGVLLIKRRFQDRCFPVNIAKCLRTPILKNNCEWLLLRLMLRSHRRVPPYGLTIGSHWRVLGPGSHFPGMPERLFLSVGNMWTPASATTYFGEKQLCADVPQNYYFKKVLSLLKSDSSTIVFLWILRNFWEQLL